MTRSIILRPRCSPDKALNAIESQHWAYPAPSFCCLGCTWPVLWQHPAHPSARSASNTAPLKARKQMDSNPTRWLFAMLLGSGCAQCWHHELQAGSACQRFYSLCQPSMLLSLLWVITGSAVTDPRKSAILHFSLQCQNLPTPLGTPE